MLKPSILLGSRYCLGDIVWSRCLISWWHSGVLYYGEFIHVSGELSARLLIITLAVTLYVAYSPESCGRRGH